jgi:hypothetical protein
MEAVVNFLTPYYQRHNQRRQEHLSSLALTIAGKTVLEVGAGIGDHTSYFLDRKCIVTCTDGRNELLDILKKRYPEVNCQQWDVEATKTDHISSHQIVYAYGLLYHTSEPEAVLERLAAKCTELLCLETCVSYGHEELINLTSEATGDPTQALRGTGCRPTRTWIFKVLKSLFPYVYLTRTQPWHEEFPIDWINPINAIGGGLIRSVFIAAKIPLDNPYLSPVLLDYQER